MAPLGASEQRPNATRRPEVWIPTLYAAISVVWIFVSDSLVSLVAETPEAIEHVSMAKGWGFVLVTALLLHFVLRRSLRGVRESEARLRLLSRELQARNRALRALAARLETVREEEKTRMARDLHDELGQLLTALKIDLRWIERRLGDLPASAAVGPVLDRAVAASELVDQTTAAVHRIAADLRPSALDQLGLGAALEQELRRFRERTGLECVLRIAPDLGPVHGQCATVLYRVAQEALTNVARHADGKTVTVVLERRGPHVALDIEDDGRGLDEHAGEKRGLGLLGMRERCESVGGAVTIATAAGGGTRVTALLPCEMGETPLR